MQKRDRRFLLRSILPAIGLALALTAGAGPVPAHAAGSGFPRIPVWAFPGAFQDSSSFNPRRCVGEWQPRPDSIRPQARTVSVRFLRDRRAEARPDFAGYRIWRVVGTPDTSQMTLIRRFSLNIDAPLTWRFSLVDTTTLDSTGQKTYPFKCAGKVVHDSVVTFVDPDSNGNYVKVCRRVDQFGRCLSRGDSVLKLVAPPGPHDGFRTWYAITYEALNVQDNVNLDLFVPGPPDTSDNYARCGTYGDTTTCPRINLNNKAVNMIAAPVEPTGGPTTNLLQVSVVPNPYRAHEAWDQAAANEVHFINLPANATIKIYTAAGDLVVKLQHDDPVRDFERWDLKNQSGKDVASGIYVYRVESAALTFQNRFVLVR
ncbi:MAG: hypothetical protein HYR73_02125 [Candidatus Eisenbacteria bacterium]|nr:hypothetical protein [Candidatus Eisenbacteria bacterium]